MFLTSYSYLTCKGEKRSPTKKLADQLMQTATEVAIGRPLWVNNSVTKNQGIEPGPVANPQMNRTTAAMARYFIEGMDP